ncbi:MULTISPECIES: hypothetical protein [unclassified Rhodococcus (in: high G+C Gram-positive bacteria)]|uniref:hypothetical protein n=1 Tax=unclassified Rhodococcus (in: high G+C Gram-positive bacteria) TaxID=192944 RepID=UPI0007BC287C|nr:MULTISPECIES: hypothetical protein [unclassified Rhodococcus (in: high G+C Gram-positive bacteria)]KZE99872.1 hypothetical protein A2J02_08290 [Rhodococcus sp. EPR-147]KZF01493.1 hypothetical protein A2J04_09445 [Rhodococcus sp. EPR-279]
MIDLDALHLGALGRQPKIFWVFVAVAVVAAGVIVVDSRASGPADVALPDTPASSGFSASNYDQGESSTTIPGCDAVVVPESGEFSGAYFRLEGGRYDDPRYPWFSGRKATALSDALVSALPAETAVEFATPGTFAFGAESAFRFGPVQGPTSDSSVGDGPTDDLSMFASATAAGLLIRNGRGADVTVTISKSTAGVPPCVGGSLDRRQVAADGTVVDTKESTGEDGGRTAVVRTATAYATDGTTLQANASQFVSSDEAVSMNDLISLVSSSELRIGAAVPDGTRPPPLPCDTRVGSQDGPAVTRADADRIGRALDQARIRALRAVIVLEQPLAPMQRSSLSHDSLCAAGTILTPGSEGVVTVAITGGQPLPEIPDAYDPTADRSVDTVRLPDGSMSERSKRGVRTVTVTRPSGTRVRISSTSAGELVTVGNLESIATAPGLDL